MPQKNRKIKNKPEECEPDSSNELNKSDKSLLPDDESILSTKTFISPKGKKYRIIKTNEKDEYEEKEN